MDHQNVIRTLLAERSSCRGFLPGPIPREKIRVILAAAQRVPSWCNAQPWHIVVCGTAKTEALRTALSKIDISEQQSPDISYPVRYQGIYRKRRQECGW